MDHGADGPYPGLNLAFKACEVDCMSVSYSVSMLGLEHGLLVDCRRRVGGTENEWNDPRRHRAALGAKIPQANQKYPKPQKQKSSKAASWLMSWWYELT